MANLVEWIEEAAAGEPVEAVVIADTYAKIPTFEIQRFGVLLPWSRARPMLDYEFDEGLGAAANCNAIYAWTAGKVIFVVEYDGATRLKAIPRNPTACDPEMATL